MKLRLRTTNTLFNKEISSEINYVERLKKLGFEFETDKWGSWTINDDKKVFIEINSFKDLTDFIKEWGDVILNEDTIQIYDGYNE